MFFCKNHFGVTENGFKELQHLEFLLVGVVGGGLGLQLVYGYLDPPQQQTHLGGICIDVKDL